MLVESRALWRTRLVLISSLLVTVLAFIATLDSFRSIFQSSIPTPEPTTTSVPPIALTPEPNTVIAEISSQGTRIAALENTLQTDPQNAVSLLLIQRDIESISASIEQTQRDIDRLYTIVLSTLVALLLILVGAIIPFAFNRLRALPSPPLSNEKNSRDNNETA